MTGTLRAYFSKDRGDGIIRILWGKLQKCQVGARTCGGDKLVAASVAVALCEQVTSGSLDIDAMRAKRNELLKAMLACEPPPPKRSRTSAGSRDLPAATPVACKRPAAAPLR